MSLEFFQDFINTYLAISIGDKINIFLILINVVLGVIFCINTIYNKTTIQSPRLRLLLIVLATCFLFVEVLSLQTIYLWEQAVLEGGLVRIGSEFTYYTRATENAYLEHISYAYNIISKNLRSISYLLFFSSLHFLKGTYRKWQI